MVDKSFIITSNARNEHMLKEAGDFANHLKHCEKDIRALKNATEGGSSDTHSSVHDALICLLQGLMEGRADVVGWTAVSF